MSIIFIEFVRFFLGKIGIKFMKHRSLVEMQNTIERSNRLLDDMNFMVACAGPNSEKMLVSLRHSKSQIRQDLFVLNYLNFKLNGFFVEFGGANGVDLSNTYLMERCFSWRGIVAEPAVSWHDDLKRNRNCIIESNCVWRNSHSKLNFNETHIKELSTISEFSFADRHATARKNGVTYEVETISLIDMLIKHNAPNEIDYLSIDTEGSEFEILNAFDFSKYQFNVISCEHNYAPQREQIFSLLKSNGYRRVFEDFSLYDDWYVRVDASNPTC